MRFYWCKIKMWLAFFAVPYQAHSRLNSFFTVLAKVAKNLSKVREAILSERYSNKSSRRNAHSLRDSLSSVVRGFLGCKKAEIEGTASLYSRGLSRWRPRHMNLSAVREEEKLSRVGARGVKSWSGESMRVSSGRNVGKFARERKKAGEKGRSSSSERSNYFRHARVSARYPRLSASRSSREGGDAVGVSRRSRFTVNWSLLVSHRG